MAAQFHRRCPLAVPGKRSRRRKPSWQTSWW